ncbi:BTB/POZ domain-containing protein 2-like [Folsomia candida]|uniref:BTB/POZ domain-containing protein 2-like n=1 Tax=Folsomia candida TaxID=158441 RepID=UPI000B9075A2|nr:BTB/POZ domain-containing protein 2-like [Folsomia candida]
MSGDLKVAPTKTTCSTDWRKLRPGPTQKLAYILESKELTDVTFSVGSPSNNETIHAHRLVLAMYSTVFEAMFQGPLAAGPAEVIQIPDIEPHPFNVMLKFIYTGEFQGDLPVDGALAVLYAARKYDITDLELVCTDHVKKLVSPSTAISILQTAQRLDIDDLTSSTSEFATRHFDAICRTEDFLNITLPNLVNFLKDDNTHGQELDLFHGVVRWTNAECNRRNLEPNPLNRRSLSSEAIASIRFSIIPVDDFALHVVPQDLLTSKECTLLFQHMVVDKDNRLSLPKLPFNTKKRTCSTYTVKFYDEVATTPYVDISAGWFNKFTVDQPVTIVSFGFYGPHTAEVASYQVSIKLLKDSTQEILAELTGSTVVAKMKEIFHVLFPKPVAIYPGCSYRAWFSLKGPLTCHGSSTKSGGDVYPVSVNCRAFDYVKFTYVITGAHQLPEIAFQI